jgi:hypothetical protein
LTIRLAAAAAAILLATAGCSQRDTSGTARAPSAIVTTSPTVAAVVLHAAVRRWWQRAAAIPQAQYFDPKLCGLKQPPDVWLLGGGAPKGQTHRRCALPAHQPILVPVVNEQIPAGSPSSPPLDPIPMDVRLDGRPITPTRVDNDQPYKIRAVPGNALAGIRDGERVTDRGYWVLLPGLAPGRHQLIIRTASEPDSPNREWTLTAS